MPLWISLELELSGVRFLPGGQWLWTSSLACLLRLAS
jgi:hypothetical protein